MSTTWMDDMEIDDSPYVDAEYDDDEQGEIGSEFDGGEEYDDAEAHASRHRRAQQRRVALARRRQATARSRARRSGLINRPASAATTTSTATAVRDLDLESKVAEDGLRRAATIQGKRMSRAEYASVAGVAVNQVIDSFGAPNDPFIRAALRFSPLLLLAPQRRGTGFGAFATDPRVLGAAAVAGITLAARNRDRLGTVRRIEIIGPDRLTVGGTDQFFASPTDNDGSEVGGATVDWTTSNDRATVDRAGNVTAGKDAGPVTITARSGAVVKHFRMVVEPSAASSPSNSGQKPTPPNS